MVMGFSQLNTKATYSPVKVPVPFSLMSNCCLFALVHSAFPYQLQIKFLGSSAAKCFAYWHKVFVMKDFNITY